jgi:ferredoxin
MLDSFKRKDKVKERKKLHCAYCKRATIHKAEARCVGSWNDRYNGESGGQEYTILRCGACDTVCYETVTWDSHEIDYDEDNEPYHPRTAVQYPAPVSAHFNFNTESTPGRLDDILGEMLYALAGSKMTLATIGLRLAVEFIVNDKKCKGSNLAKKIDDLHALGHVDVDQKDLLHRLREKGNAGAHEAVGMSAAELVAGMSIIEGLLEKLYNGPARHKKTIKRAKLLLQKDEEEGEKK